MAKTQKELAFLRDLYINDEWTRRFTDLADKHLKFAKLKNLLYVNAGTGAHAFELREKIGKNTALFATCEDDEILKIARDKSIAIKSDIDFSIMRFDDGVFDTVLADASFVRPSMLEEFVSETVRVARKGGDVVIWTPAVGSFGEIFSLIWEVFFNENMTEHESEIEAMIAGLPSVSRIEEIADFAGLADIETHATTEIFEYAKGSEFIGSPLITDFILPAWLKMLNAKEKERVVKKLAHLIDAEDGDLAFRFSVKVTLLKGEKI